MGNLITIKKFHKGETLDITFKSDYLSSEYDCRFVLQGKSVIAIPCEKLTDGSFLLKRTSEQTLEFAIGKYKSYYKFYNTDVVRVVEGAEIEILEDILAPGLVYESEARRRLNAIKKRIDGEILEGVAAFNVDGRSVNNYTLTELVSLEEKYQKIVDSEGALDDLRNGIKRSNKLSLGFRI